MAWEAVLMVELLRAAGIRDAGGVGTARSSALDTVTWRYWKQQNGFLADYLVSCQKHGSGAHERNFIWKQTLGLQQIWKSEGALMCKTNNQSKRAAWRSQLLQDIQKKGKWNSEDESRSWAKDQCFAQQSVPSLDSWSTAPVSQIFF